MFKKLLIANRGEIAIRVSRAAAELGIPTVAVFSRDDATALHVRKADEAVALDGVGPAAYLDVEGIVGAARQAGCDALHPGYGFLSESAALARACAEHGIRFVGPHPEALELFGDKVASRGLAGECGVPVPGGTAGPTTVEGAREVLAQRGAIMLKAVSGGGGRGMRVVADDGELEDAFARSSSEAQAAFGNGALYVEQLVRDARHIEVQVAGDGQAVSHFWERDCTIQRRHQKLVEVAPSPSLAPGLRDRIIAAAVTMARHAGYDSLGTFEFLVEAATMGDEDGSFVFIEANPRLQVEHTVTEEVTGVDLVQTQLRLAAGATLAELGLTQDAIPAPRGFAIQLRVNMETMDRAGHVTPAGGTLDVFEVPSGPGIRVDSFGYAGYRTSAAFDSLLAKLVVSSPSPRYEDVLNRARRALTEFRIEGVETNITFLGAVLRDPRFAADEIHTRFVEDQLGDLVASAAADGKQLFFSGAEAGRAARATGPSTVVGPPNTAPVAATIRGTVVSLSVAEGDQVIPGQPIAVIEAMKMEHVITALEGGIVRRIVAAPGDTVEGTDPLAFVEAADVEGVAEEEVAEADLDEIRPDLAELLERKRIVADEGRPKAVARRHGLGKRTTRENIADLVDEDSFTEYGPLVLAAQRGRRSYEELLEMSPADGLIAGLASINGDTFDDAHSRAMVIGYDWTVFAGTQGIMGHHKTDRALLQAQRLELPIVLFAEGGGGRPGDTEIGPAGLDVLTFWHFSRLSGMKPIVGVTSRFCFAGNAALLGCCDVIIATEDANIGMGGPAMIEGGGLGVVGPKEIGPAAVQSANGVIDILVADEAEAVAATKKYLSYFQGPVEDWDCVDQRLLRRAIPENRLRAYDIRAVIEQIADTDSVLELRRDFGVGMITALVRVEGRPMGLIANNPRHLGGAVDADAADKGARFMQLCDAYDLPILSLCDTPGFMVGPDAEAAGQVRHVARLFVTAANVSVPMFTIVLRKGYGLGAQGSTGGSFHAPIFLVAWPTGEFGGMGLEGHVRLAFRRELEAIDDPAERDAEYQRLVAQMYHQGRGISMAEHFEIDDVIDPADTRRWVMRGLKSVPPRPPATGKRRPNIDTW
jgi:acetyl/propionyl-CoA carboxylase alpha subunit/acetyl-CoA carboxylase carboxyltransferase component